ncbi:hypothetical protein NX059_012559 [Plenodomus lindquistii]|nr:hypothetical protein NX059_012559 [Plenodomus lindquistii]
MSGSSAIQDLFLPLRLGCPSAVAAFLGSFFFAGSFLSFFGGRPAFLGLGLSSASASAESSSVLAFLESPLVSSVGASSALRLEPVLALVFLSSAFVAGFSASSSLESSLESSLDSSLESSLDSPFVCASSFFSSVDGASFISSSFFSDSAGLSSFFSDSSDFSSSFFSDSSSLSSFSSSFLSPLDWPLAPSAFLSTLSSDARFTTSLPERSMWTAGLSGSAFFLMVLPRFDSMAISPCSLTSATSPPGLPEPQFHETVKSNASVDDHNANLHVLEMAI